MPKIDLQFQQRGGGAAATGDCTSEDLMTFLLLNERAREEILNAGKIDTLENSVCHSLSSLHSELYYQNSFKEYQGKSQNA